MANLQRLSALASGAVPCRPGGRASNAPTAAASAVASSSTSAASSARAAGPRGDLSNDALVRGTAHIRELFPDLGEGFVRAALRLFGGNVDRLADAILRDDLPPQADKLPRDMPLTDNEPVLRPLEEVAGGASSDADADADDEHASASILGQRASVFAGDQFDINVVDRLPANSVYQKSRQHREARVNVLGLGAAPDEAVREATLARGAALYDDEYDDSYDIDGTIGRLAAQLRGERTGDCTAAACARVRVFVSRCVARARSVVGRRRRGGWRRGGRCRCGGARRHT